MKKILGGLLIIGMALSTFSYAQKKLISLEKSEYKGTWIFNVDEVALGCLNGDVTVYDYENDKEYPLTSIDAQTRKLLFIEASATPILKKGANTAQIIKEGTALCIGKKSVDLDPDVSDTNMIKLAENRVIANLQDPSSFKAISHDIKKDDDNIFVTVKYQANDNGTTVNGIATVVFDYYADFVRFQ